MILKIGQKVLISGSYTLWDGTVGEILYYLPEETYQYVVDFGETNVITRTHVCYFKESEMIPVETETIKINDETIKINDETIGAKEENHE